MFMTLLWVLMTAQTILTVGLDIDTFYCNSALVNHKD